MHDADFSLDADGRARAKELILSLLQDGAWHSGENVDRHVAKAFGVPEAVVLTTPGQGPRRGFPNYVDHVKRELVTERLVISQRLPGTKRQSYRLPTAAAGSPR